MCTYTVPLVVTLGSYFSHCHCFHKVYMCMNVHTCTHTLLCTQPVHHIFVTHTAHTHTVHLNTYIHSCTVHLYARILMKTLSMSTHTHTHTCTLHVRSILNLFSAPAHALYPFNCFMHVFDFYTLSLCSLRVELPYGWFSVHRHSHHRSRRCEIKLSYWAQPVLNFFLFAMLSFVPLA